MEERKQNGECTWFSKPSGCDRGRKCKFWHPRLSPKDGRCFNCGAAEHTSATCPRKPKASPAQAAEPEKQSKEPKPKAEAKAKAKAGALQLQNDLGPVAPVMTLERAETLLGMVCEQAESYSTKVLQCLASGGHSSEDPEEAWLAGLMQLDGATLLDSGATHDLRYSTSSKPKHERTVECDMAHGSKMAGISDDGSELTFYDDKCDGLALVSLGRLIAETGSALVWDKLGARLVLPGEKTDANVITLELRTYCPFVRGKDLLKLHQLQERRRAMLELANLKQVAISVLEAAGVGIRLRTHTDYQRHKQRGHVPFSPDCPDCRQGVGVRRPHRRAATQMGGELSVDIAGPFAKGIFPTDRPTGKVAKFFLIGAFIPYGVNEAHEKCCVRKLSCMHRASRDQWS